MAGLKYKLGVDGISLPFVLLTAFFFPIAVWSSWKVEHRVKEYFACFLILETLIIGVFTSLTKVKVMAVAHMVRVY